MLVEQGRLSICAKFAQAYQKLDKGLQNTVTYVFSRVLSPVNQRLLICEMEQVIEEVSSRIREMLLDVYSLSLSLIVLEIPSNGQVNLVKLLFLLSEQDEVLLHHSQASCQA